MSFKQFYWLIFGLLFGLQLNWAQGGDLLIQQYSKGPGLNQKHSKWILEVGPEVSRLNTTLETTSPTITIGAIAHLEYRLSKTTGLVSGINYSPLKYSYVWADSIAFDALKFVGIPIYLRMHPTDQINISLGGHYNYFFKGEQIIKWEDSNSKKIYDKGIFRNTYGLTIQVRYNWIWNLSFFANYRWAKRSSPLLQRQTNNCSGLQLGCVYSLWRSKNKY